MPIGYEVNPPRLPAGAAHPDEAGAARMLRAVGERVASLDGRCDFVHVTESVLGTRRLSPIATGRHLKKSSPGLSITVTMRTRDRTAAEARAFAESARAADIDGILVVMGDPLRDGAGPPAGGRGRPLAPSRAVREMRGAAGGRGAGLYLSVPSSLGSGGASAPAMQAKIAARPAGFFTQVVSSVRQVRALHERLAPMGFRVVPIVIVPSEANKRSAQFLGIDWSGYERDAAGFVRSVHRAAGDVLVTSPNDFAAALDAIRGA